MNKIQRVSKFLRVVFQIAFVAWPLILILYWTIAPDYLLHNCLNTICMIPERTEILHHITRFDITWGLLLGLIPTVVQMTIICFLIKLFKLYEQNKIFTLENVKYLKKIGIFMLINQIGSLIYEGSITFALTFHNPPGHRSASITFGSYDTYAIITAIMIIVISWIMAEGCKLQEEQKYTV